MKKFLSQRLKRLETFLEQKRLEGAFVTFSANIRYFTGFSGGEGVFLAIPPEGFLIVDPRYTLRARVECATVPVLEAPRPMEEAARLVREKMCRSIGLESARLTMDEFRRVRRHLTGASIKSLKTGLDRLRMVKDAGELARIQKAVDIHTQALNETLAWVTPDVTERDWAVEFEYRARRLGAEALSFDTIVASGPRSAIPHATADPVPLPSNAPVVFDHGIIYGGYCSDETATFFTTPPPNEFETIYQVVKEAHDAAIAAVRPGRRARALDAVARGIIQKAGYGDAFTHSTGHGVGLEIHEAPTIGFRDATRLEPGMVFTIEPGIYLPGRGGVRIEDMVYVTETGCRVLTKRPKFLTVLFE